MSTINYGPGQTVANEATIDIADDGTICVFSTTTTDVLIDVPAYSAAPVV